MNGKSKILLIFALIVLATGVGLAIAQPGSLGGDDDDDQAAPARETTTTVEDTDTTTDDTGGGASTSTTSTTIASTTTTSAPAGGDGPPTTFNEVEDSATTNTTQSGSGLGSSGAAQPGDTSDGLAATGGESLLLAGVALGAGGIAARRRLPRSARGQRLR